MILARSKQTALMEGNGERVGYWITPWDEDPFPAICEEFGFDPPHWKKGFDPCPFPRPAGYDGLKEPWPRRPAWVNPPFRGGEMLQWSRKSIAEASAGTPVVFIMPTTLATAELVEAGAEVRSIGRVDWRKPSGRSMPHGRPQLLFILRPKGGPSIRQER